jgi:hypothetical protein
MFSIPDAGMSNRDPYTFVNGDKIPKPVLQVITTILKSWDMPQTDYRYVSMFKRDGALHVLAEPTKGEEGLRRLHDNMINAEKGPVVDLQHKLDRIFTMPGETEDKTEVMFTGTVTYVLVDGKRITTEFATWMVLSASEEVGGALRTEYLRVFSDTSELTTAIGTIMGTGEKHGHVEKGTLP